MNPITPTALAWPALRAFKTNLLTRADSLNKLSTGLRINSGADDPAGLIASENLRSALAALEAETRAYERSDYVIATAESALGEINNLINDAEALAVASANTGAMSDAEIEANQMQMDSIRNSINRIADTASFNGQKLFDGQLTFRVGNDSITVDDVHTSNLGNTVSEGQQFSLSDIGASGSLSLLAGNLEQTQQVLAAAADDISKLRGQLGSFSKHMIQPAIRSLSTAFENVAAAESLIRDTDYAAETSRQIRADILVQSSGQALMISNEARQTILTLIG